MEELLILGLVGLTSLGATSMAARGHGLSRGALAAGIGEMLECVGAGLIFFVVNLVAGVVAILTARALTPGHLSLYLGNDVALLALSFLQGLTFQCWRNPRRAAAARRAERGGT